MEIIASQVKVKSLTQEDIVNLLTTAITDCSQYLYLHNPKKYYETYCKVDPEDGLEERCAKVLLAGGKIRITDYDADGAGYPGNDVPFRIGDEGQATYTLSLDNIIDGLENAANGSFIRCGIDGEAEVVREAFDDFAKSDESDLDYGEADMLMQIILFGEVIYG